MIKKTLSILGIKKAAKTPSQRKRMIGEALDHAFMTTSQLPTLGQREVGIADAVLAIKANTIACLLIAGAAEEYIRGKGVKNIVRCNLQGHYVLRDAETGLLHDLECYEGVKTRENLTIWSRKKGMADLQPESTHQITENIRMDQIKAKYEVLWLKQREQFWTDCHKRNIDVLERASAFFYFMPRGRLILKKFFLFIIVLSGMMSGCATSQNAQSAYYPAGVVTGSIISGGAYTVDSKVNPIVTLFEADDFNILPARVRDRVKICYFIAESSGNFTASRVDYKIMALSCLDKNNKAVIDQDLDGYILGNDGQSGVPGKIVKSKISREDAIVVAMRYAALNDSGINDYAAGLVASAAPTLHVAGGQSVKIVVPMGVPYKIND